MDPLLYKAAISGEISFLETLTADEETAYFSHLTPKKNTVLHLAAEFKQTNFFRKVCLKCNPSLIWQQNSKDETPLHVATRAGCLEIVEFFIEQASISCVDVQGRRHNVIRKKNRDGDTALHCAVRNDQYHVVECLLKTDPDLSSFCNYSDESPLYLAVAYNFIHIASLIIRLSSPSFSHMGPKGLTALHEAACNRSALKMMEELVEKRPEIIKEAEDAVGWTPLHYAACRGLVEAVKILLKYDISAAYLLDHAGNSAIHVAALLGKINVIKELIQICPDIFELTNKKAQTALHIAVLSNQVIVIKYILGNSQLVRLLNEPDEDGNTPLHFAVLYYHNNHTAVIEMLAKDTRVNINSTNKEFKAAYDIYWPHYREHGFKEEKVRSLLKGSSKARLLPHFVSDVFMEMLNRKPELKPFVLGFTEHQERKKNNYLKFPELVLVVATLVTTVSFSAAFAVPGGYITDGAAKGTPILADKAAFKAFEVFNIVSFFSSLSAVYFQSGAASTEQVRARYQKFQSLSLGIGIIALALAFASGIYTTLANSHRALATAPYVLVCGLLFIYHTCAALDPHGLGIRIQASRRIGKYHFQIKCGGPAGRLFPIITYKIDPGKDGSRGGREGI